MPIVLTDIFVYDKLYFISEKTPAGKQKTVQRGRKRKSNDSENESHDENEEIIVSTGISLKYSLSS